MLAGLEEVDEGRIYIGASDLAIVRAPLNWHNVSLQLRLGTVRMGARIRITDGSSDDLIALHDWLRNEDELRGRVGIEAAPIGDTELGAGPDLLTVAFGAGGAGTVLASSLIAWLKSRRTSAKITVESGGRSVTLEVETTRDVRPILEEILRSSDAR